MRAPFDRQSISRPIRPLMPYVESIGHSGKRMAPYWISAALTGLVAVLFAKLFSFGEEISVSWATEHSYLAFGITPVIFLISAGLAAYFAPLASGSGIPQLIAALEISRNPHPLMEKLVGFKTIVIKMIGACISVIGGGMTGREGPMLQISAGIFYLVRKYWPTSFVKPNLQSMILAGGAAGLASAFNTPLGGVIFAIEELAKSHISTIRTYAFHAVIIAGLIAQAALGNYLYFGKIAVNPVNPHEYIPLVFMAAIVGLLAALSCKLTLYLMSLRAGLTIPMRFVFTAVCGVIVACFIYFDGLPALGSGRTTIVNILAHTDIAPPWTLGFVRGFGNIITFSSGVVGGVFAPALSTGAAFGAWAGGLMSENNHHVWTLVGMVAFLTGVTRSPFTSFILVLEMTDTQASTVHLMLGAVAASSAAKLIDPVSFYEHLSHRILVAAGVAEPPHVDPDAEPVENSTGGNPPA